MNIQSKACVTAIRDKKYGRLIITGKIMFIHVRVFFGINIKPTSANNKLKNTALRNMLPAFRSLPISLKTIYASKTKAYMPKTV